MTDNLSERERRLVEAVRAMYDFFDTFYSFCPPEKQRLENALAAYDPPRKEYVLPTWGELAGQAPSLGAVVACYGSSSSVIEIRFTSQSYNRLREATAKEVKP